MVDRLGLVSEPPLPLCSDVLSHLLHVVEHKTAITPAINTVARLVSLLRQVAESGRDFEEAMCHLLDVVGLLLNRHPESYLRVIQCTYSLI